MGLGTKKISQAFSGIFLIKVQLIIQVVVAIAHFLPLNTSERLEILSANIQVISTSHLIISALF